MIHARLQSMGRAIETFQEKLHDYKEEEEVRLIQFLSEKYQIPTVFFSEIQVNPSALQVINEADAHEARMAPFSRSQKKNKHCNK